MHMADALISPVVGGTMWALTAGSMAYSIKKIENDIDDQKVPLMGVMGAFVFAAQMINFTIPATGSSGHIGGGMLLSILLGPYAGFLTMASILMIQALFFGDGGLLALGCNIFNLGFYTCFIMYPLIYKPMLSKGYSSRRIFIGSMLSAVMALQFGAFSVVLETFLSGKTELPFGTFLFLMQPIHLAIGLVEGMVTAAIVGFVWQSRPEIIDWAGNGKTLGNTPIKKVLVVLTIVAVLTGGILSWFGSSSPDGLEWSMLKTSGKEELQAPDGIHQTLEDIQEKTAFLPDYSFKTDEQEVLENGESWPGVSSGTTVSGLVGGAMTLVLVIVIGQILQLIKKRKKIVL